MSEKPAARFCRHCGGPINPDVLFCPQCGQPVSTPASAGPRAESHPPVPVAPGSSAEQPSKGSSQGPLPRWALAGAGCALMLLCIAGGLLTIALWPGGTSNGEPTAWDNAESELLHTETVNPSDEYQVVEVGDTMSIVISGGLLDGPQELSASAVSGGPELQLPLPSEPLGVFEISLGENTFFSEPLFIELPYDPNAVKSPLAPEHALVASYWDEALEEWIEMPSAVDTERQRLVIPTLHLTKVRYDYVIAEGHVYNDYFSIKYDPDELEAMKTKYPNFEDTLTDYVDDVAAALEEARRVYEEEGFRELQKIKGVEWASVPAEARGVKLPPYHPDHTTMVKIVHFNVYITGDRHDESWSWKGIFYSSLSRSKFTGNIYVPYDHSGVQGLEIAHEVFHSIQNRYYNLVGMTEIGLPGSTSPGYQLLTRLWWLEATAEYAAGKLVHPRADGRPNAHMGGDIDHKYLEKALTHSPSVLRKGSDDPSYNNAWFIEFLVSEKDIDFKDMFETVASDESLSVYTNLASYLEAKGPDIDEVYTEFAFWWLFSSSSPLQRQTAPGRVPDKALASSSLKEVGQDLTDWHFEGGSGRHRAKIWEVRVAEAPQPALSATSPRAVIVSLEQERIQGLRVDPPARRLWLIKWTDTGLSEHQLTYENPLVVEPVTSDDVLYLLAVRNDDLVGVLTDWYPEVRVTEAQLDIEPAEIVGGSPDELHTFTATANNIPEDLVSQIRFEWEVDGESSHASAADGSASERGAVTASLKDQQLETGEHTVVSKLYDESGILLAEDHVDVNISDLVEAPTPTAVSPLEEGEHAWVLVDVIAVQDEEDFKKHTAHPYDLVPSYGHSQYGVHWTYTGDTDTYYDPDKLHGESITFQGSFSKPPDVIQGDERVSVTADVSAGGNNLSYFTPWAEIRAKHGPPGGTGFQMSNFTNEDGEAALRCDSKTGYAPIHDTLSATIPGGREGDTLELSFRFYCGARLQTAYIYEWK